jgi:hypothetical protein
MRGQTLKSCKRGGCEWSHPIVIGENGSKYNHPREECESSKQGIRGNSYGYLGKVFSHVFWETKEEQRVRKRTNQGILERNHCLSIFFMLSRVLCASKSGCKHVV